MEVQMYHIRIMWKDLFELAGFNYNKKTGTYHAHPDAWQQIGGYNYVYDIVFDYATNMESVQFEFVYNDEKFIIWAWKGDYLNLGAGSEMGIYKNLTINGKETDQWVVDRNYSLYMSATLVGEDGYNIIYQYNPSEKQWWITGFNPNYQNVTPEQLTAYFSIKFDNEDMYKQFCKTIDDRNGLWWFNDSEQTAGFCF